MYIVQDDRTALYTDLKVFDKLWSGEIDQKELILSCINSCFFSFCDNQIETQDFRA